MPKIKLHTEDVGELTKTLLNQTICYNKVNYKIVEIKPYDAKFDPERQYQLIKALRVQDNKKVYILVLKSERPQNFYLKSFAPKGHGELVIIDGHIPHGSTLFLPNETPMLIEGNVGDNVTIHCPHKMVTVTGALGKNCKISHFYNVEVLGEYHLEEAKAVEEIKAIEEVEAIEDVKAMEEVEATEAVEEVKATKESNTIVETEHLTSENEGTEPPLKRARLEPEKCYPPRFIKKEIPLIKDKAFCLFEAKGCDNDVGKNFLLLTFLDPSFAKENFKKLPVPEKISLSEYHGYIVDCVIPSGSKISMPVIPGFIINHCLSEGSYIRSTEPLYIFEEQRDDMVCENILGKHTIYFINDNTIKDKNCFFGDRKLVASLSSSKKNLVSLSVSSKIPLPALSKLNPKGVEPQIERKIKKEHSTEKDLTEQQKKLHSLFEDQLKIDADNLLRFVEKYTQKPTGPTPMVLDDDPEELEESGKPEDQDVIMTDASKPSPRLEKNQTYIPKPHQLETYQQVAKGWSSGLAHIVIEQATGTGKTNEIIDIYRAISVGKVKHKLIFVVPLINLVDQTMERFKNILGKESQLGGPQYNIETLHNGKKTLSLSAMKEKLKTGDIIVCVANTFFKKLGEIIPSIPNLIVVIDEAHTALSENRINFIKTTLLHTNSKENVQNKVRCRLLATTATPFLETNGKIRSIYEVLGFDQSGKNNPVKPYGIIQSIQNDTSCPVINALIYPQNCDHIKFVKNSKGSLNQKRATEVIDQDPYNKMLVAHYLNAADPVTKMRLRGKKALYCCGSIKHSERVAEEFNQSYVMDIIDPEGSLAAVYKQRAWEHYVGLRRTAHLKLRHEKPFDEKTCKENFEKNFESIYGKFTVAAAIHSKRRTLNEKECRKILLRAKLGGNLILTNDRSLIEGYDDPGIEIVVITYTILSLTKLLQAIGRGFRIDSHNLTKILYVFQIVWGRKINAKYFHECLRDIHSFIPRFAFPAERIQEYRAQQLEGVILKEDVVVQGAHPYSLQWEPKRVENKTIEEHLLSIDKSIYELKMKLEALKLGNKSNASFGSSSSSSGSLSLSPEPMDFELQHEPKQEERTSPIERVEMDISSDDEPEYPVQVQARAPHQNEPLIFRKKRKIHEISSSSEHPKNKMASSKGGSEPWTTESSVVASAPSQSAPSQSNLSLSASSQSDPSQSIPSRKKMGEERIHETMVQAKDVIQEVDFRIPETFVETYVPEKKESKESAEMQIIPQKVAKLSANVKGSGIEEKLEKLLAKYVEVQERLDAFLMMHDKPKNGKDEKNEKDEKLKQEKLSSLMLEMELIEKNFKEIHMEVDQKKSKKLDVSKKPMVVLQEPIKTITPSVTLPETKVQQEEEALEENLREVLGKALLEEAEKDRTLPILDDALLCHINYPELTLLDMLLFERRQKSDAINLHSISCDEKSGIYFMSLVVAKNPQLINEWDIQTGKTPLHAAFDSPSAKPDFCRFLLEHKANVNAVDNEGQTPLHILARYFSSNLSDNKNLIITLMQMLSHPQINLNIQDKRGYTPLHYSVILTLNNIEARNIKILCLLAFGADVSIKDNHGITAFEYSSAGNIEIFGHGVNAVLQSGSDRRSILSYLYRYGMYLEANELLKKGVDPNLVLSDGRTLFMEALRSEPYKNTKELAKTYKTYKFLMIKQLLHYKANVNVVDNAGLSPLEYFIIATNFSLDIAELILNATHKETLQKCDVAGNNILHRIILDIVLLIFNDQHSDVLSRMPILQQIFEKSECVFVRNKNNYAPLTLFYQTVLEKIKPHADDAHAFHKQSLEFRNSTELLQKVTRKIAEVTRWHTTCFDVGNEIEDMIYQYAGKRGAISLAQLDSLECEKIQRKIRKHTEFNFKQMETRAQRKQKHEKPEPEPEENAQEENELIHTKRNRKENKILIENEKLLEKSLIDPDGDDTMGVYDTPVIFSHIGLLPPGGHMDGGPPGGHGGPPLQGLHELGLSSGADHSEPDEELCLPGFRS